MPFQSRPSKKPAAPREPKATKKSAKQKQDSVKRARLVIQRRTLALLLVFGVASFLALFAKAYDLTINQSKELQARATRQQTQSTTISASRGSIYDRNGVVLARSATADTIFLDPNAIQKRADELDQARALKMVEGLKEGEALPVSGQAYKDLIATTLAEILDLDADDIQEMMKKTWSQYEVLRKRVDKDVGDAVRAFITENATGSSIQGVHIASDAKRYLFGLPLDASKADEKKAEAYVASLFDSPEEEAEADRKELENLPESQRKEIEEGEKQMEKVRAFVDTLTVDNLDELCEVVPGTENEVTVDPDSDWVEYGTADSEESGGMGMEWFKEIFPDKTPKIYVEGYGLSGTGDEAGLQIVILRMHADGKITIAEYAPRNSF